MLDDANNVFKEITGGADEETARAEAPYIGANFIGMMHGGIPKKWDCEANFAVFLDVVEKAAAAGVELLVTPECWLDGYAAPEEISFELREWR